MIKVSIIQDTDDVHTRNATSKDGQPVQYYNQFGYAHLGDAFPVKIKLPIESPAFRYPVGDYKIALSSFQVGRYDSLEINSFNLKLTKLEQGK